MARQQVEIDRKSLKNDAVRDLGFELIDHAYRHRVIYGIGAVALVIVVAAALGYVSYDRMMQQEQAEAFHAVEQKIDQADGAAKEAAPLVLAAVEDFISKYPDAKLAPIAWMYLAKLAWTGKDLDKTDHALRKVLELTEDNATLRTQARVGLAKVLAARGKNDESAAILRELPDDRFADLKAIQLGRIAMEKNDADEARKQFKTVVGRKPASVLSRWAQEALSYSP